TCAWRSPGWGKRNFARPPAAWRAPARRWRTPAASPHDRAPAGLPGGRIILALRCALGGRGRTRRRSRHARTPHPTPVHAALGQGDGDGGGRADGLPGDPRALAATPALRTRGKEGAVRDPLRGVR